MISLCISGKARSGKDTVAKLIVQHSRFRSIKNDQVEEGIVLPENKIKIISFALPMKRIVEQMFPGCDRNALYGPSELRNNIIPNATNDNGEPLTYRQVLLDIGKRGRAYNENIWINALAHEYKNTIDSELFIVPDQRFVNELDWLKSNKFISIRVKRQDISKINDISETEQEIIPDSDYDYIINNDETLEKLSGKVKEIVAILTANI